MWTAEKRRKAVETRKKNGGYKNSHKFTKKDLEKGVETRRKNGSYNKNLHGEWTDEMRKNMSVAQLNRPPCKDTTRKKLSESNKGKVRTEEMKKRYSISRIEGLANGALKLSGRGKDKEYKNMKFWSHWEVKVAKWFDENNIKYEYETQKCKFKLSNKHYYTIDFYLPELNIYVEVKGWWGPASIRKVSEALNAGIDIRIIDERNINNINLDIKEIPK